MGYLVFLACKNESIYEHSPNPPQEFTVQSIGSTLIIISIRNFFSEYETLFRYVKPGFINPALLEDQKVPLKDILDEEAIGMAFPVDSSYFDEYPLVNNIRDW